MLTTHEVVGRDMLIAKTGLQLEASQPLLQLYKRRYVALVLLVVAVLNIALSVLKAATPAGIGVLLANGELPLPQRKAHDEFLGHHAAARLGLGVYVAILIVAAQFLLLVAAAVLIVRVVGIEVDGEAA